MRPGGSLRALGSAALDFEQAYDDNIARVFAFFAYRLRTRADAEDLTQQTFERALKAWDRFDPRRAAAGTWLIAIARNLLIDHHRAQPAVGSTQPLDSGDPSTLPHAALAYTGLGLAPELAHALSGLAERDREILAFGVGAALTGPELAELTGLTLS